ncbi:MAG: autotransporter outer membrane beta-barrel domain-containing protein [Betaproteobacteria bacterium]|nr:autotransporter outer membrane beta-barrel domain-containing protein [Betaproteobacteria bacterium]
MKNISRKLVAGVALAGVFGLANATPCDSALSSYGFYIQIGDSSSAEEIAKNHSECFPGGPVTSNIEIAATAGIQAAANSNAVTGRLLSAAGSPTAIASNGYQAKGLAAGGMPAPWNVWGNVDQTNSDFSYTAPNLGKQRGDNDILTTVIGVDYALTPSMVLGISASFDNGDGSGRNSLSATGKNKTDTDGYMIAPYIGFQLDKNWAVDASVGFGDGDYSATGGVKADIDRWFAAANLSYSRWVGNWQFNGKAGYLYANEETSNAKVNGVKFANTSAENTLGRLRISAQASYWMNGFMPYAGLGYTSNVHRDSDVGGDPLGRDTFVATLGVNFFSLANRITGGIYYEEELDRSHSDNHVIAANINFRF